MIYELLQKWAGLQPDWCKFDKYISLIWVGSEADGYPVYIKDDGSIANRDWQAIVQRAAQDAIASHGARLRLENGDEGWHVTIAKPGKNSNLEILVFGKDKEPALAILSAWIEYLEIEQTASAQPQTSP